MFYKYSSERIGALFQVVSLHSDRVSQATHPNQNRKGDIQNCQMFLFYMFVGSEPSGKGPVQCFQRNLKYYSS